jgi:hypothetical protein
VQVEPAIFDTSLTVHFIKIKSVVGVGACGYVGDGEHSPLSELAREARKRGKRGPPCEPGNARPFASTTSVPWSKQAGAVGFPHCRRQRKRLRCPETSHTSGCRLRFVDDSPVERDGFEPSVPRKTPAVVVISALVAPPSPLRQAEPTRAPLSKPGPSHAALTVRSGLFQR